MLCPFKINNNNFKVLIMTKVSSEFISEIKVRGFIHQATDLNKLDSILSKKKPQTGYIGFDCTAKSLHVGSLMQIMLLRWFQKTGHRPIVLLGEGTSLIGDPSGKDESRKLLNEKTIITNSKNIKKVFEKFINFNENSQSALMINNAEWLTKLSYIEFLRDFGKHFSVNRMLNFDSVKLRLEREQTLSFLEFNYMILQAYDFLELNRRYSCILQMGGSDQWGNIVNGVELNRRVSASSSKNEELYGLTSPLITNSSGGKMGKTEKGAIWLDPELLSPWEYWQFWRNTSDQDVSKFLKLFTEIDISEINKLEKLAGEEINEAKKVLATEATALLHGRQSAAKSESTGKHLFEKIGDENFLPKVYIDSKVVDKKISILDLFLINNLLSSKSEARRLIRGGGAKINDKTIKNESLLVDKSFFTSSNDIKLSAGKKRHIRIILK